MTFRTSTKSRRGCGATGRPGSFLLPFLSTSSSSSSSSFSSSWLPRGTRLRGLSSGQRQQVMGEDSQPHPAFHALQAAIAAAREPVPAFEGADAPFASRAPAPRPPKPALLLLGAPGRRQAPPPRQSHVFDLARGGRSLVGGRGKSRIRRGPVSLPRI